MLAKISSILKAVSVVSYDAESGSESVYFKVDYTLVGRRCGFKYSHSTQPLDAVLHLVSGAHDNQHIGIDKM